MAKTTGRFTTGPRISMGTPNHQESRRKRKIKKRTACTRWGKPSLLHSGTCQFLRYLNSTPKVPLGDALLCSFETIFSPSNATGHIDPYWGAPRKNLQPRDLPNCPGAERDKAHDKDNQQSRASGQHGSVFR